MMSFVWVEYVDGLVDTVKARMSSLKDVSIELINLQFTEGVD